VAHLGQREILGWKKIFRAMLREILSMAKISQATLREIFGSKRIILCCKKKSESSNYKSKNQFQLLIISI
jgi:hypothetical protein